MTAGAPQQRGFALLVVLWMLVLLTVLLTQLTSAGRTQTQLASNLRHAAIMEAQADGALHTAIFRLLDSSEAGWNAGYGLHRLKVAGGQAEIRIIDEGGKINPNSAPPKLLQALLRVLGVDSAEAAGIAAAIVEWRHPTGPDGVAPAILASYRQAGREFAPPGAPFLALDELASVIGVTPSLLARLRPHLSLYHQGEPDPSLAGPVVVAAIALLRGKPVRDHQRTVSDIRVVAINVTIQGSGRFVRHAIVRLRNSTEIRDYQILTWDIGI